MHCVHVAVVGVPKGVGTGYDMPMGGCGSERTERYAPSGKRKVNSGRLKKLQMLRLTLKRSGASNQVMNALMDGHDGLAAKVRNVANLEYQKLAAAAMGSASAVGLNWDGAMYGGLSVNIGMAVDCISLRAVHLQPIAPWRHFYFFYSFMKHKTQV